MNYFEFSQKANQVFQIKNYLYSMTIYHIFAGMYFLAGIKGFGLQTLVGFDDFILGKSQGFLEAILEHQNINMILIMSAVLLAIDFILLIIIWYDFKGLGLTWNKIYIIEGIIFLIALFVPEVRVIMMFLSLNTLQIFFFYHVALWFEKYYISIPRYIIVLGGYILLLKIITFPVRVL